MGRVYRPRDFVEDAGPMTRHYGGETVRQKMNFPLVSD
jgi:hypothetical protein